MKFYLLNCILSPGGPQCLSVRTSLSHNKDSTVEPETSQNRKRKLLHSGLELIGCGHEIFPWIRLLEVAFSQRIVLPFPGQGRCPAEHVRA